MRIENISVGDTLEMDGVVRVKVLRKLELTEGQPRIVVRPERPLTSFYTERCVYASRLAPLGTGFTEGKIEDKILF